MNNKVILAVSMLFCLLFSTAVFSQNQEEFFKYIPKIKNETPTWAVMMYAENPNVREVEKAYERYFEDHVFEKTIHTQNYKHWFRLADQHVDENGFIVLLDKGDELRKLDELKEKRNIFDASRTAVWTNIGPDKTYNSNGSLSLRPTQTNVYCIAAAPSDSTILYCGTEGGGFFKSIDHGLNWFLTTIDESFTSGADVKIHPIDPDIVYVGTGRDIYKTIDGGLTWSLNYTAAGTVEQLYIHKTEPNKVFAATANGLYYTNDDAVTWSNIRTGRHWDIEANPKNPNTMYLATKNTTSIRAEIFKSIDGGTTWTLKDTGWYVPTDLANAADSGCKIGLTPADTSRVYACLLGNSKAGDQNWIGVYYSLDGGDNWVDADGQDGGPYAAGNDMNTIWYANGYSSGYNQGWYNFDMDVSHNNPDRIWIGTIWDLESNNRGQNLEYFRSTRSFSMHADVQDIDVVGNDIWITSDGGINYSNDEFQTNEIRTSGISASNFWGFSQGWNEDTWAGGRYHNGDAVYHENFGVGNTMFMGGAEAATGYINQFDNRKSYYSDISSRILPDALNQSAGTFSSLALYPNSSYGPLQSSEIEHDPRYGEHMLMGRDNILYKSTDEGVSFNALYTFPTGSRVYEFEIARINPDLIYCLVRNNSAGTIYKSLDGGISFNATTTVPFNNIDYLDLTLNQANPDHLWVISRYGSNGQKVYMTPDGGVSWVNKTTAALDGFQFWDIDYQTGSNDIVYLLSQFAVFHWDANASDWVMYSDGLPFRISEAREIKPFYRDSKLRLSGGRGIWEAPFAGPSIPIAQPMTRTDKVYCNRDTIQLDCYSYIDHAGASWNWSFDPAPAYIDNPNTRNPRVAFDQNGAYEVTLTVMDGNGVSSSQTVADFITMDSRCQPDTIPGYALKCSNSGDYANIPNLDLNTNTFTVSAWVKPVGIQPDYTGIVMNDGTGAGLNFRPGNQLAYHWPGGAWWWNSGLSVEEDVWSHVAMVVTPSSLTVYLNGIGSTHNVALSPVDIRTLKIGSYQGWGGRNFTGDIDEVAIWNRSLTQEEIREIRHLTHAADAATSTGLVAYYQFNNIESTGILDKIGTNVAISNGSATKIPSSAPVAGGESHRLNINAAGTYTFGDTEVEMTFGADVPNGEVVVSRLHVLPNEMPSENPNVGNYWVINNYGTNTFDALSSMRFKPFGYEGLSPDITANPSIARLYKRISNEHLSNWTDECGAILVNDAEISFDNTCNQTSFSQFTIVSNDPVRDLLPIELLTFRATAEDNRKVRLDWITASEINNDFFSVERSGNTEDWELIETVDAGINGTTTQTYKTYDNQPLKGLSYYRLKQTDLDGTFTYSELRNVFISKAGGISIFPNPTKNEITVLGYNGIGKGRLKIYSSNGKLKKDIFITNEKQNVDISNLVSGIYFYTYEENSFLKTGKLVITE